METNWINFGSKKPNNFETILVSDKRNLYLGYLKNGVLHESMTGKMISSEENLENWYWTPKPQLP